MKVFIPPPLHSYTAGVDMVELDGGTLEAALSALEDRFPGIRFRMIDEQGRIRPHIKIFLNAEPALDLDRPVSRGDEVRIICALSGG